MIISDAQSTAKVIRGQNSAHPITSENSDSLFIMHIRKNSAQGTEEQDKTKEHDEQTKGSVVDLHPLRNGQQFCLHFVYFIVLWKIRVTILLESQLQQSCSLQPG